MNAYWSQWSHEEITSMYGIEKEDYLSDNQEDQEDNVKEHEDDYYIDMDSLGLSCRDFI